MNKIIEQVIDIEKQAQALNDAAVRDAEDLPVKAQQEAQKLLETSKSQAELEARRLLEKAPAQEEASQILSQAEEQADQTKTLASKYIERAVTYVLDQVAGRENSHGR
jgi:vacuolar-type H+-ATPase subunit H